MSFLEETRFIERLQFFNGQRLFAPDLQGVEAFNREMRWLHNKSLHQPGIGSGFAVYGKKGERQVSIGPGYAIDALGREIVLTESRVEPVPPVAAEPDGKSVFYDLTVFYPDDSELEEAETREGVCLPRGVVRLREAPVFCWVRLKRDDHGNLLIIKPRLKADIKNGLKIVLAQIEVLNCQLENDVSIGQRRSARPAKQPYVACGMDKPTWQIWELVRDASPLELNEQSPSILPFGLTANIKTDTARFVTTPCYSTHIIGSRKIEKVFSGNEISTFLIDGLVHVADDPPPTATGFTVNVVLLRVLLNSDGGGEINRQDLDLFKDWTLVWMGVEG